MKSLPFSAKSYAGSGDEVIHTEHGFAMYRISTLANGATPVEVRERDRVTDVDAILAACTDRTRSWCSSPTPTTRPVQ